MPGELFNFFCIEIMAMDHSFKYLGGLALRRASPKLLTCIRVCWMVVEYCMIRTNCPAASWAAREWLGESSVGIHL